jgi:hypothetical protein
VLDCFADSYKRIDGNFFPKFPRMNPHDLERRVDAMPRGARTRLAKALSLDTSTVSKIFKGKRKLRVDELEKVDAFLREGGGPDGAPLAPPGMVPVYGFAAPTTILNMRRPFLANGCELEGARVRKQSPQTGLTFRK